MVRSGYRGILLILGLGLLPAPGWASRQCFASLSDLHKAKIHTVWRETTADDGKPLQIAVSEKSVGLYVDVEKGGESWITGPAKICRDGDEVSVRLQEGMKIGSSVPTLVGMALKADPELTMKEKGPDRMRVSTLAWGGDFQGSTSH